MTSLALAGDLCVAFYYHMHGVNVGTLNLRLKQRIGASSRVPSTLLFSKSGKQSLQWVHTSVDMTVNGYRAQLVFEATVGERHLSDIAVDDVKVGE